MTLFGPDVSDFEAGLQFTPDTPFAAAKATQGTGYTASSYTGFKAQAEQIGAIFWAYHFLQAGNASGQAAHAYSVVGKTPLMLDWEPYSQIGSNPTVADAIGFVDAYRALGGLAWSTYLPPWYWRQLGSPSLAPIASRGLALISSNYPAAGYSDTGPGWAPYGGMTPTLWQYTDRQDYGAQLVDFNAYRGTVAQLAALVNGAPAPTPTLLEDDMILLNGFNGPAVAALSGGLLWPVQDSTAVNAYTAAGVKLATIDAVEYAAITAAIAANKTAITLTDAQVTALGAAIAAGIHLPTHLSGTETTIVTDTLT